MLCPDFVAKAFIEVVELVVAHAALFDLFAKWAEKLINARGGDGVMKNPCGVGRDVFAGGVGSFSKLGFGVG